MKRLLLISATSIAVAALPALAEDAKTTFEAKCAACHGKDGKGDTKMGKKLEIKDWTDAKVQEALKDDEMAKAIKEGIKDGAKTKMKGFADLSDDQVKALVAHVRSLKK